MKNRLNESWDGYPVELRDMLISLFHDDGAHSHGEVLRYLTSSTRDADCLGRVDALTRLSWVNEFFMFCFDPEFHKDAWVDCANPLLALVKDAERILSKFEEPSAAALVLYPGNPGNQDALNVSALSQNLNAYGAVAAGFAGEEGEFASRLRASLDSAETNIRFVTSQSNANYLIRLESPIQFGEYFPGLRPWTEPLAYIAHAAPPMDREDDLVEAYSEYASFLSELASIVDLSLGNLIEDAEATIDYLEGVSEASSDEGWSPF